MSFDTGADPEDCGCVDAAVVNIEGEKLIDGVGCAATAAEAGAGVVTGCEGSGAFRAIGVGTVPVLLPIMASRLFR